MLARSVEATTIPGEGRGATKGEVPCFILHTGISPEGGARARTIPEKYAEAVDHPQNPTWSLSHPKRQRTHWLFGGSRLWPKATTTVRAQPPHTCQT